MSDAARELWGALPVVTLVALVLTLSAKSGDYLRGTLRAYVLWVASIWVGSNVLSFFNAIGPIPLRIFWCVAALASVAAAARTWKSRPRFGSVRLDWPGGMVWGTVVVLLALAFVTAVAAPPVTVDVLNYHAPRQLVWLQQGSLAPFLTVNDRAVMMPPLAELIGLQFLAITGNDHWANFPQWLAYALLPLAIVATLRPLQCSRWAIRTAVLLAMTLPMAYQEASNGKNDLQEALWIGLVVWVIAEDFGESGPVSRWRAGVAGVVIAMALLTKSTAFVFLPPLFVAGAVLWWRRDRAHIGSIVSVTAAVALALTSVFFVRNLSWYGSPLGTHRAEDGGEQTNHTVTPAIVASNLVRNATLHVATPELDMNTQLERAVRYVHESLGISVDDPRSTLWVTHFGVSHAPTDETRAGAPAQILIITLAVLIALVVPAARSSRWLAMVVIAMAMLFCATLKWQPWSARLQLPGFVVGCILSGALVDCLRPALRPWCCLVLGFIVVAAWIPSREVSVRPLWTAPTLFAESREVNSYRTYAPLRERDDSIVRVLREAGAREIALSTVHDLAYPLMTKIRRSIPGARFFGAPAPTASALPDAVAALGIMRPMPLYTVLSNGVRYRLTGDFIGDGVYLPIPRIRELGWQHRLPAFAGWDQSEAFPLRINPDAMPGEPRWWRELPGPAARVEFTSASDELWLRGTVVSPDRSAEKLTVIVNGTVVAALDVPSGARWLSFELPLAGLKARNELKLERTRTAGVPLLFGRLVLDDSSVTVP